MGILSHLPTKRMRIEGKKKINRKFKELLVIRKLIIKYITWFTVVRPTLNPTKN